MGSNLAEPVAVARPDPVAQERRRSGVRSSRDPATRWPRTGRPRSSRCRCCRCSRFPTHIGEGVQSHRSMMTEPPLARLAVVAQPVVPTPARLVAAVVPLVVAQPVVPPLVAVVLLVAERPVVPLAVARPVAVVLLVARKRSSRPRPRSTRSVWPPKTAMPRWSRSGHRSPVAPESSLPYVRMLIPGIGIQQPPVLR